MKYIHTSVVSTFARSVIVGLFYMVGSCLSVSAQSVGKSGIDISSVFQSLTDRGEYIMIPRASVIHIPQGMEGKLGRPADGRLLTLDQFLRKNYVWLHKMPVTLHEAQGKVPIAPSRLERVAKLGKVVIAVHKGKVITVKKIKEPIAKVE